MEIKVGEVSKTTYLYQVSRKLKRKSTETGPLEDLAVEDRGIGLWATPTHHGEL